jgi:hypothetical protein
LSLCVVWPQHKVVAGVLDVSAAWSCSYTFIVSASAGSGQDNNIDALKCGRWAQNNDLYGGNALIPFLDFCQIAGNQCNSRGMLCQKWVKAIL